jgi:REP element-mobilizing transposase RayT
MKTRRPLHIRTTMTYGYLDPESAIRITRRKLPHWEQADRMYFITFRTADSLPTAVREQWIDDRDRWLWSHGIDVGRPGWKRKLAALPPQIRQRFLAGAKTAWQQALDACHGDCLLRDPRLRTLVMEAVLRADGVAYDVDALVVMPNHVHVLVGMKEIGSMRQQCRAWKYFSASRINRTLGRRGTFWQADSYDHVVRSPEALQRLREYIVANPVKAKLHAKEFTLHVRADPCLGASP